MALFTERGFVVKPCSMRRLSLGRHAAACALACALTVARAASPDSPAPAPAPSPPPATPPTGPVQAAVRALVNERVFKEAVISLEVADVDTGQILAAFHEHTAVNPASNAKLYTAAAALATLHGDHRFVTALLGNVKGSDGHRQPGLEGLRRPVPRPRPTCSSWCRSCARRASGRSRATSWSTSASSTRRRRRPASISSPTSGPPSARRSAPSP